MAEHPNVATARAGFEAFARGDFGAMAGMMAEDIVWHHPGKSPAAGTYKGREEVTAFLADLTQQTQGSLVVDIHDVVGNAEHVVVLQNLTAERNGKKLDQKSVNVFHMNDEGKLTERWLLVEDSAAFDDFWS